MPELPEVETVVRGLRPRLTGQRILRAEIHQPPSYGVVKGSVSQFRKTLQGADIRGVERRAKYILVGLDTGGKKSSHTWIVHLGMSGQLYACKPQAERLKHTHLVVSLSSGEQVRFCDPRRFGKTLTIPSAALPDYLSKVGPDPLKISRQDFHALLEDRKAPVKNLLLNQTLLGGVGNIYANEALYLARIHPAIAAGKLTGRQTSALHKALKKVLLAAIAANGTTVSDYRTSEGEPGWYQNRLRVYDREGRPCPRCRTKIRRLVLTGRSAHYCPACQPKRAKAIRS